MEFKDEDGNQVRVALGDRGVITIHFAGHMTVQVLKNAAVELVDILKGGPWKSYWVVAHFSDVVGFDSTAPVVWQQVLRPYTKLFSEAFVVDLRSPLAKLAAASLSGGLAQNLQHVKHVDEVPAREDAVALASSA